LPLGEEARGLVADAAAPGRALAARTSGRDVGDCRRGKRGHEFRGEVNALAVGKPEIVGQCRYSAGSWRPLPRTPGLNQATKPNSVVSGQGVAALRRKATISTSLSGPAHNDRFCQKGRVTSLHNHDGP